MGSFAVADNMIQIRKDKREESMMKKSGDGKQDTLCGDRLQTAKSLPKGLTIRQEPEAAEMELGKRTMRRC